MCLFLSVDLLEALQKHFNVWNLSFWRRLWRIALSFSGTWGRRAVRQKELIISAQRVSCILKLGLATLKNGAGGLLGTATELETRWAGFRSLQERVFFHLLTRPDQPWGPPSLDFNGYRCSVPGVVKRPEREVVHSTAPLLPWWLVRDKFIF